MALFVSIYSYYVVLLASSVGGCESLERMEEGWETGELVTGLAPKCIQVSFVSLGS